MSFDGSTFIQNIGRRLIHEFEFSAGDQKWDFSPAISAITLRGLKPAILAGDAKASVRIEEKGRTCAGVRHDLQARPIILTSPPSFP